MCLHGENDLVASTKRFVNIASANQNCWGDNFSRYGDNCNSCGNNSYCCSWLKLSPQEFWLAEAILTKRFAKARNYFFRVCAEVKPSTKYTDFEKSTVLRIGPLLVCDFQLEGYHWGFLFARWRRLKALLSCFGGCENLRHHTALWRMAPHCWVGNWCHRDAMWFACTLHNTFHSQYSQRRFKR